MTVRRFLCLLPIGLLAACHLVDRRTFDPTLRGEVGPATAGKPAATAIRTGPRPLLTIRFETGADYEATLRLAVREALRRRPEVQFRVVTAEPAVGSDADQIAALTRDGGDARAVASAILDDGVDPGQVGLGAEFDPGLTRHEVRVYVQ